MPYINLDPEKDKVLKEKHICWFSAPELSFPPKGIPDYVLYEVVERWYGHPQAPGCATLQQLEIIRVRTAGSNSPDQVGALKVLEAINGAVTQIEREGFGLELDHQGFKKGYPLI